MNAMTTEIVEYSKTEAALSELASKYKGVIFDCSTREGLATAVKGRAELRSLRVALEKTRKEIKEPALRRTQLIDSEARRITAALEALEVPIDEQIKKEEARKEFERTRAEREAKEKAEAEERAKREAEERRLAEERAEIDRQRAELARAEAARQEAERQARLKIEEEQRAARLKIEEEERAARREREEADRQARIAREAEEARLKVEREKIEADRRAVEEQKRKEREAEEAREREIRRKLAEVSDAREMLIMFKERFGHIQQFEPIVKAIDAYIGAKKKATA
jgi:hypothetical protein